MDAPKLFVSYSWTTPDHEAWVLQLATELRESGVNAILDKWDLKEGHDAYAFMEKMVTDPDIKKVILVCDKAYADKTDGRSGGVGTEAQIISGEIYQRQDQDKFVAIVVERDEEGRAYLPAYYRSRIYIDLSDPSAFAENFERLLRWIYDKPLYEKPDLGGVPGFLSEEDGAIALATSARFKRALAAIRGNHGHAIPATVEYLTLLAEQFERLRIDPAADPFDEAVVNSIKVFQPYRNEAVELFLALALYMDNMEARSTLHRFFEQLIPYLDRPVHVGSWRDWDSDNYRFIIHELFLYAIACLVRYERFESAAHLMGTDYYVPGNCDYGREAMAPFEVFRKYMRSLEQRKQRLKLNRLSLRADLLKERCIGVGIEFRHLMQADFILFMRDCINHADGNWHWWPETLLYAGRHSGPFEVFARSKSVAYFERAKLLLGVDSTETLRAQLELLGAGRQPLPRWEFESFSPYELLGLDGMGNKP